MPLKRLRKRERKQGIETDQSQSPVNSKETIPTYSDIVKEHDIIPNTSSANACSEHAYVHAGKIRSKTGDKTRTKDNKNRSIILNKKRANKQSLVEY